MKWMKGRQRAPYEKLKLFSFWRMDAWLIRYSAGLAVGYHRDIVKGFKHYRLNIQLRGVNRLCVLNEFGKKRGRFDFFRSDELHSFGMTLEKGLILSLGFVKRESKK